MIPPVVFGFRRGAGRRWAWCLWGAVALAMALLGGGPGLIVGLLLLGVRYRTQPPRYGALVYFPVSTPLRPQTPCLWLDSHRVVLGAPYRVVYHDELRPADFARLRRLCRGLPL